MTTQPLPTFETPILFIIFNREDTVKKVFESIRRIRPAKLFIAADGPRKEKEGEQALCDAARKAVETIDWPCEVLRKYRDDNVGSKINMSEAITWFFDNVEEGIILEDDCLPDPTFFTFCQELLRKYRTTPRVKMISGNNFQFGKKYGEDSYYFSLLPSIWGWATWRRAWSEYDITMKDYPRFKEERRIEALLSDTNMQRFMLGLFDKVHTNMMKTWAARWIFSIYNHDGIAILPSVNLVSNIGFGDMATNTKDDPKSILNSMKTESIHTIIHPQEIVIQKEADSYSFYKVYYRPLHVRIFSRFKKIFGL